MTLGDKPLQAAREEALQQALQPCDLECCQCKGAEMDADEYLQLFPQVAQPVA